jgi:hypothetical protein
LYHSLLATSSSPFLLSIALNKNLWGLTPDMLLRHYGVTIPTFPNMTIMKSLWLLLVTVSTLVGAFPVHLAGNGISRQTATTGSCLQAQAGDDDPELLLVKNHLADNYPQFSKLLEKNDGVWKALAGTEGGFTVFAPNAAAYQAMGETKCGQLLDERNLETTEKVSRLGYFVATSRGTIIVELKLSGKFTHTSHFRRMFCF